MRRGSEGPLLSVRNLAHHFRERGRPGRGRSLTARALRGVSFDLSEGECLAIVGESGSGKTTLVRCILRLLEPAEGEVLFRGTDVLSMSARELLDFRRKAQVVFQDPFGSLNPRLRAGAMLNEILRVHGGPASSEARSARVADLLRRVGLRPEHEGRFPHEFSGGQRQRLGIARALSVEPDLLILDEPVSALDLSVQAQILNLLKDLQEGLELTVVLVAHDLSVVRQVADRVAVMYAGRIVESAPVQDLFETPAHPYTRGLIQAARPVGAVAPKEGSWEVLLGEVPGATGEDPGCAFFPRCPHPGKDRRCAEAAPGLQPNARDREVACWKENSGGDGA